MQLNDAAEGVAAGGGKGSGVDVYPADKVHVDERVGAAAGALNGEVVEGGQFNAVQRIQVFRAGAAAHGKAVAKGALGEDAGVGL